MLHAISEEYFLFLFLTVLKLVGDFTRFLSAFPETTSESGTRRVEERGKSSEFSAKRKKHHSKTHKQKNLTLIVSGTEMWVLLN